MATTGQIEQLATQLLARFDKVQTVDEMTDNFAHLGIEDAYRVQLALVDQRCARGERIVGRKVAFTSRGTMTQFGVTESAFGTILSGGVFADGEAVPVSLIRPGTPWRSLPPTPYMEASCLADRSPLSMD